MSLLKLYFPQWQGSGGSMSLYDGAEQIRAALVGVQDIVSVDVLTTPELHTENGIIGYEPILDQLKRAVQHIDDVEPERIVTIGGDCSVVLAPAAYLNEKYHGDMALLWIDAHADLNTPSTSPSQRFYGMPLRCLLGEGDETILRQCNFTLKPEQVVFLGLNEPDPDEVEYIETHKVRVLTPSLFRQNNDALVNTVKSLKKNHLYVHMDFDVFMLKEFAENDGIEQLEASLKALCNAMDLVGFSTAGYSEKVPIAVEALKTILEIGINM